LLAPVSQSATRPEAVEHRDLPIEKVFGAFKSPPAEARPFVRWWWNNNQVEEGEILRELDVLKAAGIGGVEINPIASREKAGTSDAAVLVWRSKEWDRVLHAACKGARERGMTVDLIAGSGWPFGGEFLKPEEQIMQLSTHTETVTGPATFRKPLKDVLKSEQQELRFVKVHPKRMTSLEQVRDLPLPAGDDQALEVEIGEGDHIISFGILDRGYCKVTLGVPGAAGPTMDHMQKSVTRAYLDRLRGVEETWGEPLSNHVRAIFCDSIETMGANWTHDITATFQQRKGYDIRPWLPFVLKSENGAITPSPDFHDQIRRARYDWSEHVASVFLENFTSEYSKFCHDHGLLSRYQAYGLPQLMGMPEGYTIPDIPESNNWLYSQGVIDPMEPGHFTWNQKHGYMLWNKYAAAGGRLRGKKIISSEAMTNTAKVFHATLATIKQADDMNFITGITHSVLHGYNYVPPDIPFPGWIRFGSYFSEHNTWWPHFPRWVDYNSRLSSVFQETRPVAEVAILGRTADLWSRTGLERDPFHLDPAYLHRLWEPLSQLGIASDYLHEAVIQKAETKDGLLRIGPMAYQLLIVADAESLLPETAKTIRDFAAGGGKVAFVNRAPDRAPGLADAADGDAQVKAETTAAIKAGALILPGPPEDSDPAGLRDWTSKILDQLKFAPALTIRSPRDGLYSLRHRAPDADLFFFTNTYRRESSRTRVDFALGGSGLWRWNPETGERSPYPTSGDAGGFEINLRPLESILLVTGPKPPAETLVTGPKPPAGMIAAEKVKAPEPFVIETPWRVTFHPAPSGDSFDITMPALTDFTTSDDARVRTFAGTAVYRGTFKLDPTSHTHLELGWDNDFISEVEINGHKLGVNWYGEPRFHLKDALRKGENELIIRYTTTLWNSMDKQPLQPSGLIGPLTLR
jgi:hypothetical protein